MPRVKTTIKYVTASLKERGTYKYVSVHLHSSESHKDTADVNFRSPLLLLRLRLPLPRQRVLSALPPPAGKVNKDLSVRPWIFTVIHSFLSLLVSDLGVTEVSWNSAVIRFGFCLMWSTGWGGCSSQGHIDTNNHWLSHSHQGIILSLQ